MKWPILATASLLASQVSAGFIDDIGLRRGDISPEARLRRYADSVTSPHIRRQATTAAGNNTAWDAATSAACMTALMMLNGVASSPTGMSLCYNLPFLDKNTGVFQADLRLFMVAPPSGEFQNVPASSITVSVEFVGAAASTVNPSDLAPRDAAYKLISWPTTRDTESGMEKRQAAAPVFQQQYAFVGQINRPLLSANLNSSALQAILLPIVTLSARTATGQTNTTLSTSEAAFVTGQFSDSPKTAATVSAANVVADVAFIVPGTKILIFPIGLIITGTWFLIGIAVIGWGTVGRMGFREQYRRRKARADKAGYSTI